MQFNVSAVYTVFFAVDESKYDLKSHLVKLRCKIFKKTHSDTNILFLAY